MLRPPATQENTNKEKSRTSVQSRMVMEPTSVGAVEDGTHLRPQRQCDWHQQIFIEYNHIYKNIWNLKLDNKIKFPEEYTFYIAFYNRLVSRNSCVFGF
jgi:hypothetical protein